MAQKDIKKKLTEYFYLNPTVRLRVRQITREVDISLPSSIRYVQELVDESILKKTNIANITVFSADRSSPIFLLNKKLFNVSKLYSSGLINQIINSFSNPNIILFGSYSRGEDIEKSDIDIYVETNSKREVNLKKFEEILQRDIQLFKFKSLSSIKNKDLCNNIINGINLNGFVEVFK